MAHHCASVGATFPDRMYGMRFVRSQRTLQSQGGVCSRQKGLLLLQPRNPLAEEVVQ